MPNTAKIIGLGAYLPKKVLSNKDLEKIVDTTDDWIVSRTGMKERRIADSEEYTSDMGIAAASKALNDAGLEPQEIDLIVVATLTPDYTFPSTACIIQNALGCINAASVDVQAACSGYVYALSMAKAYIDSGMYKNILIVASEKLSSIVNYHDRNTCILFGDGAASCIVSSSKTGYSIKHISLGSDGEQSKLLILPAGGSKKPATSETVLNNEHYIQMEGREVFKHAVRRMESAVRKCLVASNLTESDISWMVPHQANIRIIDAIAKRFNVPKDHVYLTIQKYGNTSASSIGIALEELVREKEIKNKEKIVLFAFGAGLTWGAAILEYEENND